MKNNANTLFTPAALLIEFGLIIPVLLKLTGVKTAELGLNIKNVKPGLILSLKWFLWAMALDYAYRILQAFPNIKSFSGYHWDIFKYFSEGWYHLFTIFLIPVLWEEIFTRGLFFAYLSKLGLDRQFRAGFIKLDQTIFISALLFSLLHLNLFFTYGRPGIRNPGDAAYALIVFLGAFIVGYLLGFIRKKTDSLFWPIALHTISNFGDWAIASMLPIILVNFLPK